MREACTETLEVEDRASDSLAPRSYGVVAVITEGRRRGEMGLLGRVPWGQIQ